MKKSKPILKSYFETGDKPTESQFSDLIDSLVHLDEGVFITNVEKDDKGNQIITLSDGTSIKIEKPVNNTVQDNKIRVVNLGEISGFVQGDEAPFDLVQRINSMDPPIIIAEDEIVVFEYDYKEFLES